MWKWWNMHRHGGWIYLCMWKWIYWNSVPNRYCACQYWSLICCTKKNCYFIKSFCLEPCEMYFYLQISMNVKVIHVKMVEHAQTWKMDIPVHVKVDLLEYCAKQVLCVSILWYFVLITISSWVKSSFVVYCEMCFSS